MYTLYGIRFILLFLTYFTFHNAFQINPCCLKQRGFPPLFETKQYFMDVYHILKSILLWASRLLLSWLLWIMMPRTWQYTGDQSPCSFLFFHILSFFLSYNDLTYKWHFSPSPVISLGLLHIILERMSLLIAGITLCLELSHEYSPCLFIYVNPRVDMSLILFYRCGPVSQWLATCLRSHGHSNLSLFPLLYLFPLCSQSPFCVGLASFKSCLKLFFFPGDFWLW